MIATFSLAGASCAKKGSFTVEGTESPELGTANTPAKEHSLIFTAESSKVTINGVAAQIIANIGISLASGKTWEVLL